MDGARRHPRHLAQGRAGARRLQCLSRAPVAVFVAETSLGGEADDGRVVRELPSCVQHGAVDLANCVGR